MGLLMNAAQAGFVAVKHSHGVGLVGQRAESGGENHAAIDLGEFQLQFRFLGDHFAIDEVGFDTGGAANAPTGRDHLGDQVLLLQGDWFVHGVVLFDHPLEVFGILASKDESVAGGAAVTKRIAGRFFLPLGGLGTMGLGAVDPGTFGLSFCCHIQLLPRV